MKLIDLNDPNTLPPVGQTVTLYDQYSRPFKGKMEVNQWNRQDFYQYCYGNWHRLNFVPKGWDELEPTGNADADAGAYADMPAMMEAA